MYACVSLENHVVFWERIPCHPAIEIGHRVGLRIGVPQGNCLWGEEIPAPRDSHKYIFIGGLPDRPLVPGTIAGVCTMHCVEEKDSTIPDLLALLSESNIDTRWRAAAALSRAGPRAVDPLMKKLFDDDANVRVLAIWALGRIGDGRALASIARSAEGESGPVALAAEGALSRLKR